MTMGTSCDTHNTPPPTHNLLNNRQRNRLVRSTRKLGAILGTTPIVAEPEDVRTPMSFPYSAIEPSPTSSKRSSTSSKFSELKRSRRQASICSYPDSPDLIYASSSLSSSLISLALLPNRANTDGPPLKKKCSMKLRTPGKSRSVAEIPRPLILRLETLPLPTPSTPSTPTTPSLRTPSAQSPAGTPTTPVFPSAAETRRKRIAKLTRTLGEIIPPHLVLSTEPPKSAALSSPLFTPESETPSVRPSRRGHRSMSVDFGRENVPPLPTDQAWTTRQRTWVGEWNRKDIREVQQQLRELKAR